MIRRLPILTYQIFTMQTEITIVGDVHGKINEYHDIIQACDYSICVGDFGFKREWDWFLDNIFDSTKNQHWINPGNHDYGPNMRYQINGSTGNYSYFDQFDIFTVRGADSIDKHLRTNGIDWFENEELNYSEQLAAYDSYVFHKPKIMITHDCPQSVMLQLFPISWSYGASQTRTMLDHMLLAHQPDIWLFGHHHRSVNHQINNTRFICLNELETYKIKV